MPILSPSTDPPSTRFVLPLLNLGHFLDHWALLIYPTAVLTMGEAFGRSYGELLALATGGFVAFGAASLPAGWLGDRWNRRQMMVIFFFGLALAAGFTGLATTPLMLALGLTLLGTAAAIYHPVGIAMLVGHAGRLGTTIGVNGVAGNLGIAAAPLVTGALAASFGWRSAFFAFAAVSAFAGVAFLVLVRDPPRAAVKVMPPATAAVARPVLIRVGVVLLLVAVAGGIVFNATTLALPKLFAERAHGLFADPVALAALVSAVFVFGALGQIVVGRLIDRYPLKAVFVPLSLIQAPALAGIAVAVDQALVIAAAALMFAVFGQMTINDSIVARYTSDAWRGRAFALRYLVTFVAAATAVPLVAILHDRAGGFRTTCLVLAALAAAVFLAALIFPAGRPEQARRAPRVEQPAA